MKGPQIIPDNLLHGGTLLDVTPTVLSLLGLPAAEDMEGRVLLDAFAETPRLDRITSWEDQPEPSLPSEDSTGARGVAEHFIAFNRLNPNPQGSVDSLEEALFNLVCVYMSTGRPVPALPLIEKLAEIAPEDPRYQRSLVQCHLSLGQIDEAGNLLGRLISGHEVFGWMHFLQGVVSMHQGDVDAAFLAFRKAEQDQAYAPAVPAFVGNVYLSKGMLPRAEEAYETALGFDSENAEAHVGLAGVRLEQQRYQEAADHALKAINLQYELPNAHYQLGIALERLGDTSRALVAYRAALKLAPYLSVAQARLDRLGTSLN
jgi:tetratricopeptide (TPR) repeat protein